MHISLNKAIKQDWDFILELRNNDFQYFYEQNEPISKEKHYQYMKIHSSKSYFHHWVISLNENNVGYIRIFNQDIGIMVKKEFQGKGIASKALELVEKEAKNLGIEKIIALVDPENFSSKKIFENNGYDLKLLRFEKEMK
jgi:RimJ/RimL family protein N-acetyltransferase